MVPEELRPQTPIGLSPAASSVDARFLQDRLRLFGAIAFVIAALFYAVGFVLARLGKDNPLTAPGHAALWAVLLLTGSAWFYCRGADRRQGTLRTFDVLLMAALGGLVLNLPTGAIPEPDLRGMALAPLA